MSSISITEGGVIRTFRCVRASAEVRYPDASVADAWGQARRALDHAAEELFCPRPPARRTRILVTFSPEATADPARLRGFFATGADLVRINCAHDAPEDWRSMAAAARAAAAAEGRAARVYMDLAGPKIRTAAIRPKPGVRVRPGDRVFLRDDADASGPEAARASLACTLPEAAAQVRPGGAVAFDDGKIVGRVAERTPEGLWLDVTRTKEGGARLKPDKGINFPGAEIRVSALTAADRAALDVAA
jgi:Pyruvate kinase